MTGIHYNREGVCTKVAGFVNKSSQIETNQSFLDFYFPKTNLWTKSLRIELTNPDLRVCKSGFMKIRDLQVWICKDLFCAVVVKIHEDSLYSWKLVKSLKIGWICDHNLNPQTESFQNSKDSQTFLESGFMIMIQYTIHKSLIRFPQPKYVLNMDLGPKKWKKNVSPGVRYNRVSLYVIKALPKTKIKTKIQNLFSTALSTR